MAGSGKNFSLPRRDYILLPLIGLVTVLVLFTGAEIVARHFWQQSVTGQCYVPDPVLGYRLKPNCVWRRQSPEGPALDYRYNDCGYRTRESCRPRPAGTLRVAVLGDSVTEGTMVPYESTLTAVASSELTKACHQPVEFQNLGTPGHLVFNQYLRTDEVLRLKPDAVVMTLLPPDTFDVVDAARLKSHRNKISAMPTVRNGPDKRPFLDRLRSFVSESRAAMVAQHFIFEANSELYVRLYLSRGDKAGYLRTPLTPLWKQRFAQLDMFLGDMADRYHARGIPFAIVIIPSRVQAALLGTVPKPSGVDPLQFSREVSEIAARHGILVLNGAAHIGQFRHPETLYYPVDGHLTAEGHEWFGKLLAQRIADAVPAFKACKVTP